jgi:hypothetical protein
MDGDGRGGAALSMRAITGKPIRFVGLGEKMDALETFEPSRIAGRILGMGDIVALVEKAQETLEAEQAERMMKRFQKGQFNMNDLKGQLEQMMKMGGMQGMMGMMPGMAKMQKQLDEAGFDDTVIKRQIALINSMTKKERANPQPPAGLPQEADRRRRGAGGVRPQQAFEDAPPDVGRDEEARQDGQEGHDGRTGRPDGQGHAPGAQGHGPRVDGPRPRWNAPRGNWARAAYLALVVAHCPLASQRVRQEEVTGHDPSYPHARNRASGPPRAPPRGFCSL